MKPLKHLTFHLLYLSASLIFLSGVTQAKDREKAPIAQTQPSQGARIIQFANDHLTVKVKDISLAVLLQDIARQSGLTLEYKGSLDERITIQFHQLPFDEGLRKILNQQNFALEYVQQTDEENQSSVRRPAKLWVFSKGEKAYPDHTRLVKDARAGSSPQDVAKNISKLQAAMTSEDPREQEKAVEILDEIVYGPETALLERKAESLATSNALGERGGVRVKEIIQKALEHEDKEVNEEAAVLLRELESFDK
jgi:hypothetical protein